jgi:aminopeptidase N
MHRLAGVTIVNMQNVPRLIDQFIPENYKLELELDRTKRLFFGAVIIIGEKKSKNIILHSKDLIIESVFIDNKKSNFTYGDNDELIIDAGKNEVEKCQIKINYKSKITDSMHGLYPCYYEHNGFKKELLATQFESHHAREVFPCIDEPAAKATFDLTLSTEAEVTVLGNMPIKKQTKKDEKLITTFETTPKMSSYLLAWVVGELHKKTAHTKSGVEVNIWATLAQPKNSLDFALDIATRSIDFFDNYFDTPYPLTKADHVALPDFSSGAMENWGLITYRETALLADPSKTSISSKRYIATVIAHELSHQWFGNLVTMQWWNDLWLNESFASLVEYDAVDNLEPDWNCWLDFATFDSLMALKRDSLDGVQPVQTEVHHPDEIGSLFDGAIVYCKGARLLQMVREYIGESAFREGLKKYFKKYAYKNTVANELWKELDKASGKDVTNLMNTWISQPGFPVIHASLNDNELILRQEKLSSNRDQENAMLWPIPLNSNCKELPDILGTKSLTKKISNKKPIRLNIGSYSHFITHYDDKMLHAIIQELKSGKLSTIDRLQLLNEQSLLANAGIISYAGLIPLLESYKDETEEPVWDIIAITIGELKKFVYNNELAEKKLKNLAKSLAVKQYSKLGLHGKINEPETDKKLRLLILGLMIYSEDKTVISDVLSVFNNSKINKLDPDLRSSIISAAVYHTEDEKISKDLIKTYKKTSVDLKQDIVFGLTSSKNSNFIDSLLKMIKDKEIVKPQDTFRWFAYLIRNKYGRDQTWEWMQENWNWIEETFGGDKSYDDYPKYAASSLMTQKQLDEYKKFFKPLKSNPALTRAINMGINEITNRVNLINKDGDLVIKKLLDL